MSKVLVTGSAGFIGFHTALHLLRDGHQVVGIDNLNPYYEVQLKEDRLAILQKDPDFTMVRGDLANRRTMERLFNQHLCEYVIHLGAQGGVRYSLTNPHAYVESNLVGFVNMLEGCRHTQVRHLVYASSSSVYGANTRIPFSVHDSVDHPVSLYAATKKSNELLAHAYSHLFGLPTTGLRFFTVYGPWGRPDMALFKFTRAIHEGRPIDAYNHGDMRRDFTYIDDIVEGILAALKRTPEGNPRWSGDTPDPGSSYAPYKVYNIGNSQPVALLDAIRILEEVIGIKARLNFLPMQPGDVPVTYADVKELCADTGFRPDTPLRVGLQRFVSWYRGYYDVQTTAPLLNPVGQTASPRMLCDREASSSR
jgi:UDP-glucuronate 4-epimerase